MGETNSANPDHLDQLADQLCPVGDGATYGNLASAFDRARSLDASAQMTTLAPLLGWLMDTAGQLRDKASLLRGDVPMPDYTDIMYGDGTSDVETDPYAAFEVLGQDNIDAFLALAQDGELTDEDIEQMAPLLGAFANDPNFAAALVDQMGMDNFLELSQQIQDRAGEMEDPDEANRLREDMATILTGAFFVPGNLKPGTEEYDEWVENTPQGQAYAARLQAFQRSGDSNLAEAADLTNDLINADDLSLSQLTALNEFLENQNNDPLGGDFNRALMTEISPEGLVRLAETLPEMAGTADEELRAGFAELQTNIANSLASATDVGKPPSGDPTYVHWENTSQAQWYNEFMADFYEAGRGTYEVTFTEDIPHGMVNTAGYQMLLNLMEEGNGYSTGFLVDVAEDLQAAETDDEHWLSMMGPMEANYFDVGTPDSRIAMDPMNSVLGIMGQHPDAATEYLSNEENLDWLIDRNWSHPLVPAGEDGLPGFDYSGFGGALEAATTGHRAGSNDPFARTAEGDQIMAEVMERFSADNGALIADDGPFVDLRPQMGIMGAAFMPELQYELGHQIDPLDQFNEQPTFLAGMNLEAFLAQTARNPDGYAALMGAQQAYTTLSVDVAMNSPTESTVDQSERINNAVVPGFIVAGILADGRASATYEAGIASDEEFNSRLDLASNVSGLVLGETVGRIPGAGGALNWGAEQLTTGLIDSFKRDNSAEYYEDANGLYTQSRLDALEAAQFAVRTAGEGHQNADTIDDLEDGITNELLAHFDDGYNWDNS